ncbi:TetR/AcrR family transcriptional regulator [Estrella lausannensis]|uniref:Transcriptional regulator, TetR family n=1 Tax=Estrella lausannensis TaxID=483423 RepID=A0A0H5DN11_9BACT|nr:TetR/AcrR family transcriptional regulator [Estrella lausannensis]CRX37586.1 transcriptional regulator, TetR family [Estrella lausannensis]
MGTQERKEREREALRELIIQTALVIVETEGLESLTMRAIADRIEYSQSKIYAFFPSKDALCAVLCQDNCEKMLEILKKVPLTDSPEKDLKKLVLKTMEFHASHPHSDELLTEVCFGKKPQEIPKAFLEIEKLFIAALTKLKSPHIRSNEDLQAALDIIRCIFIGVSSLMRAKVSKEGHKRGLLMAENTLDVLLRGWNHE